MAGKRRAEAEADAPDQGSALPVLDDEGSLPVSVASALDEKDLKAVCKAAGKTFGGITVVGDRAYL